MVNFIKLLSYATSVAVSIYLIKRYFSGGICKCKTDLSGKVVIITGGTSGVGKEVATVLAKRGATVVIASRGEKSFHRKIDFSFELWLLTWGIEFHYLDLKSFSSIREFSKIIHDRFDSIYALVNNAGVFYEPFYWTEDDFDVTFQTNYLGPFLLTHLLLDLICASPDGGRVVNVTCEAHRYLHQLDPRHVNDLGSYSRSEYVAYAASKACLQLFTRKLSLSLAGKHARASEWYRNVHLVPCFTDSGVTVNDANPGNVRTDLLNLYFRRTYHPLLFNLLAPLRWLLMKNPVEGAQTPLHLILSPDLRAVTGKYFTDCEEREPSALCKNTIISDILWIQSLAWVNRRRP